MLRVGITGGIGSGKTHVCKLLETIGIPIFYSDIVGKELTNTNEKIRTSIIQLFGEESYKNNILNAKFVASKVFEDKSLLKKINAIIHPEVFAAFIEWSNQFPDEKVVALESAVLFESGFDKYVDKSIVVTAPLQVRIDRIMKRDKLTYPEVEARIKNQLTDEEREAKADFIIKNDGVEHLPSQLFTLLKAVDY
jgi:dephospho-CoA kinase